MSAKALKALLRDAIDRAAWGGNSGEGKIDRAADYLQVAKSTLYQQLSEKGTLDYEAVHNIARLTKDPRLIEYLAEDWGFLIVKKIPEVLDEDRK